jgi:hypothetical protein
LPPWQPPRVFLSSNLDSNLRPRFQFISNICALMLASDRIPTGLTHD